TVYVLAGMAGKAEKPAAVVVCFWGTPGDLLVKGTTAVGTTPPVESPIVPEIFGGEVCVAQIDVSRNKKNETFIMENNFIWVSIAGKQLGQASRPAIWKGSVRKGRTGLLACPCRKARFARGQAGRPAPQVPMNSASVARKRHKYPGLAACARNKAATGVRS